MSEKHELSRDHFGLYIGGEWREWVHCRELARQLLRLATQCSAKASDERT